MIEEALYSHLKGQSELSALLARYGGEPAIFNQEAPSDTDPLWSDGAEYSRIVFAVDIQGDPERTMGGTLMIDVSCKDGQAYPNDVNRFVTPEELEPLVRGFIDGYFFSSGTFTVAAQWKTTSYFTEPTEHVIGCTIGFALLGFPIITTDTPDIVSRFNEWSAEIDGLHVINHDALPATAWKPDEESAIYWRVVQDKECTWIPSTYQTLWREASVRAHIFSKDYQTAAKLARNLVVKLHSQKRLIKENETPIMVNRDNIVENGADPLRTGQMTVNATYGIIVHFESTETLNHINISERSNHR